MAVNTKNGSVMGPFELILSFAVTWAVILSIPAAIRLALRRPMAPRFAVATAIALFFVDVVIFTAMGSTSKSHTVVFIGSFAAYWILTWKSAQWSKAENLKRRKELGYDD